MQPLWNRTSLFSVAPAPLVVATTRCDQPRPAEACVGAVQIRSVTGACSSGQARNIALAGQLQEVQRSLVALLPRLPPTASDALACACRGQLCHARRCHMRDPWT